MCVTFAAQFQHGIQWSQLRGAALFQAADNDTRRIGFLELQLREGSLCLGVDGINGEGTGIVMRSAEVHHEQGGLVTGFHTCKHIAVLVIAPPCAWQRREVLSKSNKERILFIDYLSFSTTLSISK